jgi:hypothetical protein
MEGCTIQNNSNQNIDHLSQIIQHFFPYAQEKLGFFKPVMVSFQSDEENANKLLGKTAHYNPDDFSIAIYVDNRHPKDILRSFSHELVHHAQNCNGDFESAGELGPGYAQENEAMRNAELDAYKRGNIIFRDFEDLIKKGDFEIEIDFVKAGEPKMSLKEWKNDELNGLLMEKWGYKVQKEEQEIFAPNHYCAHHVRENISGLEGQCIDHNWNERLQEVTEYDVDFGNNDIRTLRVEELTILEAHGKASHSHSPSRVEDSVEDDVDAEEEGIQEAAAEAAGEDPAARLKADMAATDAKDALEEPEIAKPAALKEMRRMLKMSGLAGSAWEVDEGVAPNYGGVMATEREIAAAARVPGSPRGGTDPRFVGAKSTKTPTPEEGPAHAGTADLQALAAQKKAAAEAKRKSKSEEQPPEREISGGKWTDTGEALSAEEMQKEFGSGQGTARSTAKKQGAYKRFGAPAKAARAAPVKMSAQQRAKRAKLSMKRPVQRESLTIDEARDVARRIFEKISKEIK